jgi:hypothetical protein
MVEINISKKNSLKNPCSTMCQILMDWWKVRSTWCYRCNYKLVALKVYSSYSYIIITKLHMYTISHIVSYIHCNSCNLSNNTHPHRNTLCYNELQMVIVTQKPSCKASCKSPHFLIVLFLLSVIPPPIFEPFPYKVNIMSRLVLLTTSCTTPSFVSLNESTNSAKLGLGNGDFLYLIGT